MTDATLGPVVERLRALTTGWPDDLLDMSRPAFLARRRLDGGVSWYAVVHGARQSREVRDHLLAFVGPSYSDFTGQPADWDTTDPVEAELAAAAPNGFRLTVHPADAKTVEGLFARLRDLLRFQPRRAATAPPSLGLLLRDFELLVRTHDWRGAEALVERMRQRGQLTTSQLAGLRLRLLAAQERWAEVLAAPELVNLLSQRLPTSVAEGIAAAVYHAHLASASSEADAVARFREDVTPTFGVLFRQRAAWRHPDAVKAALVADAATRPTVPARPPTDPYTVALAAHAANDAQTAFRLLVGGPYNPDGVRLLVEVALDLGTLEAARAAVAAVRGCDPAVREKALSRRASRALWDELQEVSGPDESEAPKEWLGWLNRAAAGAWPQAADTARLGAKEWPRPDARTFTQVLASSGASAFPAIRDSLPSLLDVLLPDGRAEASFGTVYRQLLERVVLDDDLTHNTAAAIRELAAAVLQSNPVASAARNDYAEAAEYLLSAWQRLKGPRMLDWGLDLLDLLAEYATHRHANVAPLVQDVIGEFVRVPRYVTAGQRALLQTVCAELELAGAADAVVVPAPVGGSSAADEGALRRKLGKRSVVLLTLQDRIAATFRELMRRHYPEARVEVVQEYAGTRRLRDLSVGADVFILNTFDAKHAATGFVSQHRPADGVTLYPAGKNAARQLDALEDWLRSAP